MTLFNFDGSEIVDIIKKSGAYIFDLEWTYRIEVVAQMMEMETAELDDDDESDKIRKVMKEMGISSGKKMVSETLAYLLRSHDKAFIVEAMEKNNRIYFNTCELEKIEEDDLKGICAISGKEPKIITEKDLPEMFQTPTEFADMNLMYLTMCDKERLKEYFFDRHRDLLDEQLSSKL